jgi:hypothetical protein
MFLSHIASDFRNYPAFDTHLWKNNNLNSLTARQATELLRRRGWMQKIFQFFHSIEATQMGAFSLPPRKGTP